MKQLSNCSSSLNKLWASWYFTLMHSWMFHASVGRPVVPSCLAEFSHFCSLQRLGWGRAAHRGNVPKKLNHQNLMFCLTILHTTMVCLICFFIKSIMGLIEKNGRTTYSLTTRVRVFRKSEMLHSYTSDTCVSAAPLLPICTETNITQVQHLYQLITMLSEFITWHSAQRIKFTS